MPLTLISGPMKSGKSLELIARAAPYEYAEQKILYVYNKKNVRDMSIASRIGINVRAVSTRSLKDIKNGFDVIGIDEIHMFKSSDADVIDEWLKKGKQIFVSGLDLDYRGKLHPIIKRIIELKPEFVINKIAVCDVCKSYSARFTQVSNKGKLVLGGLPSILPEDGIYEYQARCRECFVRKS